MIGHRRGTFADVDHVLSDLSDVSAIEMMNFECTKWDMLKRARACMDSGGLDCLVENDEPLAMIGTVITNGQPYTHRTWFIASKKYFDMGVKSVIAGRRYMSTLAKSRPGVSFESLTASSHPEVERWFALLGFRRIQELDGFALYVFEGIRADAA